MSFGQREGDGCEVRPHPDLLPGRRNSRCQSLVLRMPYGNLSHECFCETENDSPSPPGERDGVRAECHLNICSRAQSGSCLISSDIAQPSNLGKGHWKFGKVP